MALISNSFKQQLVHKKLEVLSEVPLRRCIVSGDYCKGERNAARRLVRITRGYVIRETEADVRLP